MITSSSRNHHYKKKEAKNPWEMEGQTSQSMQKELYFSRYDIKSCNYPPLMDEIHQSSPMTGKEAREHFLTVTNDTSP